MYCEHKLSSWKVCSLLQKLTCCWPFPWRWVVPALSFLWGKSGVSLLPSASFPSLAFQVLLLNLLEIGSACGIAGVSFEVSFSLTYRISYMLVSIVSPDRVIICFFLIWIIFVCTVLYLCLFVCLVILNQCIAPNSRHTLFVAIKPLSWITRLSV